MAPECTAIEGLQERNQAPKMVKTCAGLTKECFKLVHAFYMVCSLSDTALRLVRKVIWLNQYT